jgi:hypothetical protein
MDTTTETHEQDSEVEAIRIVFGALRSLDPLAQGRVLDYVIGRLGVKLPGRNQPAAATGWIETLDTTSTLEDAAPGTTEQEEELQTTEPEEGLEGVNDVARKWMRRNGLSTEQLSSLFSLGVDEIDLVAEKVPGTNVKQRLRSVLLLKAIASYLGSGAPRVEHKKLKEAASHYDADAGSNMATYIKEMGAEFSGTATSGYSLTTRGLSAATKLIKDMMVTRPQKSA